MLGKAAGVFALTNIDDMVVLAVFFGQARGPAAAVRVVLGQYLGFGAILVVSVCGALGARLLPPSALPYAGLVPLLLGLRVAWKVWRARGGEQPAKPRHRAQAEVFLVGAVTFANGGDNLGVYVPLFAVAGTGGMIGYSAVFLLGVAAWCAAGWFLASRPPVARVLSRWGPLLMPVVLVGIGLLVLAQGGVL
jgi:cadmium resistance protein CadD (predicted permease)